MRLSAELLDAVERAAAAIQEERPDSTITRGDAIRVLVAEALLARKITIR